MALRLIAASGLDHAAVDPRGGADDGLQARLYPGRRVALGRKRANMVFLEAGGRLVDGREDPDLVKGPSS